MARILLVDDDVTLLDLYHHILNHQDHEVITCDNAFDALETLYNVTVDLALVDANMPTANGYWLLERLRKSPRFKTLPIAMFTARTDKRDVQKAIQMGANDYILKPIKEPDFLAKVNSLLPKIPLSGNSNLNLSQNDSEAAASLEIPVRVLSLTELGITIASNVPLPTGETFDFNIPLLAKFGLHQAKLKVLANQSMENNQTKIRLSFVALSEPHKKKISEWILLKNQCGSRQMAG